MNKVFYPATSGAMSSFTQAKEEAEGVTCSVSIKSFSTGSLHTLIGYVIVTGCIRPSVIDRLNVVDEGGQYDSSGGAGGKGNPRNSVCVG